MATIKELNELRDLINSAIESNIREEERIKRLQAENEKLKKDIELLMMEKELDYYSFNPIK